MAKLIVEEMEPRHLLSGAAGAFFSSPPSVATAKIRLVEPQDRGDEGVRAALFGPGMGCQWVMEIHMPSNPSEWPGAREEAVPRRDADDPVWMEDRTDPQPHRLDEITLEPQRVWLARQISDTSKPDLPQAGTALTDRLPLSPGDTAAFDGKENAGQKYDLFGYWRIIKGGRDNTTVTHAAPPSGMLAAGAEEAAVVSGAIPDESKALVPPPPQSSEALGALQPVELSALESAMRRFLAESDGNEILSPAERSGEALWLGALAGGGTLLAACEIARRQFWRVAPSPDGDGYPLLVVFPIDHREG